VDLAHVLDVLLGPVDERAGRGGCHGGSSGAVRAGGAHAGAGESDGHGLGLLMGEVCAAGE